jgi:transcriptional regulator with XRE-family HTH domain
MTKDEFKAAQSAMGQTNKECAEYLGISRRTVDKYRAGELAVPPRVRMLITMSKRSSSRRSPSDNKLILQELAPMVSASPRATRLIGELWSYFDALEKDNA